MNPETRIAVTGSSGLIGSALLLALEERGARVHRLVRTALDPGGDAIPWDPESGRLDPARLEGVDVVVHLAGENLAQRRWTPERKRLLVESRTRGTRFLAETLARLARPPRVFISASAIGVYGDRGTATLSETSAPGDDFLARLCVDWEQATSAAAAAGVRTVTIRSGMVLSPLGGALAKMLPPFRLGLGGPLGGGSQYVSWIAIQDAVRAIVHVIDTVALAGPVNVVAPEPVTNREFTLALGRALSRPAFMPVPRAALRLFFGEMAGMLMASQRVIPVRLLETGFRFHHPRIDDALAALLVGTAEDVEENAR